MPRSTAIPGQTEHRHCCPRQPIREPPSPRNRYGLHRRCSPARDPAHAADKVVKIGIDLSLTGADSQGASRIRNGIMMAIDGANEGNGIPGYKIETAGAGRRHRHGRPVRSGAGRDQCPQDGGRQGRGRRARPADERRRQGDGADPEPGRARDDHADLDQSRHHRPEVRRAVSPGRQADLFPHRDDRRLPGPEHGELPCRRR